MIRNTGMFGKFDIHCVRTEHLSYERSLKLFEGMWNEAVALGVLPLKDPLEGIEVDIGVAKILNSCLKKPS